jgi:Ser/Thr protein kinase RdoA (MazF antagonist)
MENIARVTEHLRKTEKDPRKVLTLLKTRDEKNYLPDVTGNWRVYHFVEDSVCLEKVESNEDFYQSALAFGHFVELLKDFPAEELTETIPDFHNTPKRFARLHAAVEADTCGRRAEVEEEIRFLFAREEEAGMLQRMRESGELPTRVTHNDTKLDNILFDAATRKPLCIIDLDTVMPGLSLYDFGDSIRFGASTGAEDEKDLSKVQLDVGKYEVFRKGFTQACPDLTDREKELLPMGAKVITMEQAARFLTDYLEGDPYYRIHYPEQNLDRTRTQIRLVQEMEDKWNMLS